jgi:hypothetical protein
MRFSSFSLFPDISLLSCFFVTLWPTKERFPLLSEYRDLMWAILFGIHILVTITIFAIAVSNYNHLFSGSSSSSSSALLSKSKTRGLKFAIAIASIVSIVLVSLWILLLRKIPGWVVYFSVIFAIASYIGVGVCLIITLEYLLWPFGVVILIFAIINIVFYFYNRQKLKFAGHVLSCVAEIIKVFPATLMLSFFSILPLVCVPFFFFFFFFFLHLTMSRISLVLFLLFSLF